jgi:hypothetical protein
VNERLDHFEREHFGFLQVGRAVRYDDSFAPIEVAKTDVNRQRVDRLDQERGEVLFTSERGIGAAQSGATPHEIAMQSQAAAMPTQVTVLSPFSASVTDTDAAWGSRAGVDNRSQQSKVAGLQKVAGFHKIAGFHLTRLHYLQLVTAFATLMFAAPISTKTSLSRSAVGPLLFLSQEQTADVRDLN